MRRLSSFALFLVLGNPAAADCSFCASEVTLTQDLARCFVEIAGDEYERAVASGLEFHPINLGGCLDEGVRRAPDPFAEPPRGTAEKPPTTSFLVEPAAITCLARLLAEEDFDPDKIKTFQVVNDCEQ